MLNRFETLKQEISLLIDEQLRDNHNTVLKYINAVLLKFKSDITVKKNLSINSFKLLLLNSNDIEDFKSYLNKLNLNKSYEVYDKKTLKDDYDFNEEFKNYDIQEYEAYKKFLDRNIKFNENLYIIEYPED